MPVKLTKKLVVLSDECVVDDAESLFQWLVKNPRCQVDLAAATHLHTAVFQALAATKRTITKKPVDAFVATSIDQLYRS